MHNNKIVMYIPKGSYKIFSLIFFLLTISISFSQTQSKKTITKPTASPPSLETTGFKAFVDTAASNQLETAGLISGKHSGSAVLGNGNVCVVYSDNPNNPQDKLGIQHYYFSNFQYDYISSGYPLLIFNNSIETSTWKYTGGKDVKSKNVIGMSPYFSAYTEYTTENGIKHSYRTFVTEDGTIVFRNYLENTNSTETFSFKIAPYIKFRDEIETIEYSEQDAVIFAKAKSGLVFFALAMKETPEGYQIGNVLENIKKWNVTSEVIGTKKEATVFKSILLKPLSKETIDFYLLSAPNKEENLVRLKKIKSESDIFVKAGKDWNRWLSEGYVPKFSLEKYSEFYKTNLCALRASNLNGAIPADVTGLFITKGMPQFYPRDAFMVARVFLLTGHFKEAEMIINFWNDIPYKTTGEFYARYDAKGQATPGGVGAPYNIPEWDSNGYYATLIIELTKRTGKLSGNYSRMKEMMDFILQHQQPDGLLEPEGGIPEWIAYIAGTNMNVQAGLLDASLICSINNDKLKAESYFQSAQKMRTGIKSFFNKEQHTFLDIRNKKPIWNTSANFGPIWGFENNFELEATNQFYLLERQLMDGGIQYFRSEDYGDDLFSFTTASAAEYQAKYGMKSEYLKLINWLIDNSNFYGLMPERVLYPQDSKSRQVNPSPLTWGIAEFVAGLFEGWKNSLIDVNFSGSISNLYFELTYIKSLALALNLKPVMSDVDNILSQIVQLKTIPEDPNARENAILTLTKISRNIESLKEKVSTGTTFVDELLRRQINNILVISENCKWYMLGLTVEKYTKTTWELVSGQPNEYGLNFSWNNSPIQNHQIKILYETPSEIKVTNITNPFTIKEHANLKMDITFNEPIENEIDRAVVAIVQVQIQDVIIQKRIPFYFFCLPPIGVILNSIHDNRIYELTFSNNLPHEISISKIDLPPGWNVVVKLNPVVFDRFKTTFRIQADKKLEVGNYTVSIKGKSGDKEFLAKTQIELVDKIDISGKWKFNTGDDDSWKNYDYKDANWKNIVVPGSWEENDADYIDYDGIAWYRFHYKIPKDWRNKDIYLEVSAIDDQDWTYFNGVQIGHIENWDEPRVYKIPDNSIKYGEDNVIAIKVLDIALSGGILRNPVGFILKAKGK